MGKPDRAAFLHGHASGPIQPDTNYTVMNPSSSQSRLQLADANGNIITPSDREPERTLSMKGA